MNNEPVAWMNKSDDETVFIENTGNNKIIGGNPIPLYTHPAKDNYREIHEGFSTVIDATHPVKTLTDEEIAHIALQDPFWWNPENIKCDIDWLGFARAILRKVQEK